MSNQFAPKKTILDHWGLKLSADPVNGSQRRPTLSLRIVGNDPVLTVWTNVQGDKDNGRIEVRMDANTFLMLTSAVSKVQSMAAGERLTIEHTDYKFAGGKRSDKPMLHAKVVVGRDDKGVAYIAVASWDKERPRIRFSFLPGAKYKLYDTTGNPMDDAAVSLKYAEGWGSLMMNLAPTLLYQLYQEPKPRGEGGGQKGNYGNRSGNSGNNYQQSNSDNNESNDYSQDDDFPF